MIRESFLNYSKNRRMNTEKININDEPEKIDISSRDEKILLDLSKEKVALPEDISKDEKNYILDFIRKNMPHAPEIPDTPDEEEIIKRVLAKIPKPKDGKSLKFSDLTREQKISIMGRSIKGDPGEGVPPGGATGQSLVKKSNADFDTEWQDTPEGFSGSYNDLSDVPTTFTPSAHTHPISDVTGLQTALDNKVDDSEKGAPNGVATLGADWKLAGAQIPVVTISEYLGNFSNTTAALANAGVQASQRGDWFTVDTSGGQTWIVTTDSPTTLSHITKVATPTDTVLSVTNSDGTLTVSPTTGNVVASLNLAHANTWTGVQTVLKTALGVTTADWYVLDNTTAATASVLQSSPALRLRGRAWLTNTLASVPVDFRQSVIGVSSTTAYWEWKMEFSGNGWAYSKVLAYSTDVVGQWFSISPIQALSNGTPGTTRHMTFNNTGSYSWTDYRFSGTLRTAVWANSSGWYDIFMSGGNYLWLYAGSSGFGSGSLFCYIYPTALVHSGHGSFASGVHAWSQSNSPPPSKLTSHGRIGWKTVFLNTNTTLTDSYYIVIANGDLNNTCTGTPTYNCSHWTNEWDCNARNFHGWNCSWYAGSDCSVFNYEYGMWICSGTSGCSVQTASCSWAGDESSCLAQDDSYGGSCAWVDTMPSCSGFDESTCSAYSGSWCSSNYWYCTNNYINPCSWDSGMSYCNGDGICNTLTDETVCNGYQIWSSCSGGWSCSSQSDESSCTSYSYFDYCSGNYSSYSCTGDYNTGACSGTYWAACSGTSNCSGISYGDCTSEAWCSQSSWLFLTFPNEWSHSVWFYAGYKIYNVGTTATITMVANTGQGILGTATIAPWVSRSYDFAWIQNPCSAYSGTDSTTCTTGHPGCSWTACSGFSDETSCNGEGGQCSWDSWSGTCVWTGNCNGTWTPIRHWVEF